MGKSRNAVPLLWTGAGSRPGHGTPKAPVAEGADEFCECRFIAPENRWWRRDADHLLVKLESNVHE